MRQRERGRVRRETEAGGEGVVGATEGHHSGSRSKFKFLSDFLSATFRLEQTVPSLLSAQ